MQDGRAVALAAVGDIPTDTLRTIAVTSEKMDDVLLEARKLWNECDQDKSGFLDMEEARLPPGH